ncbi:radical SAM protein, partial [Candidatus Sumerlaeota bacterium]|nr:radical SAM protein [Candidatus Sumerlaeota bacterium]
MWDRFVIRRKMNSFARRIGWTRAPARPIIAWITPTSRCNARCRICLYHGTDRFSDSDFEHMRPEVYDRVRRELLPGLNEIYLSGGGEPLLSPVTEQILDDALGSGKKCLVVTNGTIIKREYLERLVRVPSTIRVSVDGTTPQVFEYIRAGIKFDRVMEFLDTLKEIRARGAHPNFLLQISWVVTRSNLEQMTDCVELAGRYDVHQICFGNFVLDGGRTDEFALTESLMTQPEVVLPHWQRAYERGRELNVHVWPMFFDSKEKERDGGGQPNPALYDGVRIRQCPLPWWAVYVEVDGAVKPCCIPWQP